MAKTLAHTENEWQILGSKIPRSTRDIELCDLDKQTSYLIKLTAFSEAGKTTVLYNVKLFDSTFGEFFFVKI